MESCAAGIVLYNPDIERLGTVLNAIVPQVGRVYIVDNGSINSNQIKEFAKSYPKVKPVTLYSNLGIAAALNVIFDFAMREHFLYILTLDQDTIVEDDLVESLKLHVGNNVGIVCPRVLYDGNEDYQPEPQTSVERISWVITSGSLTSLLAWQDVKGFDEEMFIDGVDRDFCLRIERCGWLIIRDNNVVIHHRLGELKCRKVLGRTIYVTNHPAWRQYYMARNHVYLCRKGLESASKTAQSLVKLFIKVLIFEPRGVHKFALIARGVRDAFRMEIKGRQSRHF